MMDYKKIEGVFFDCWDTLIQFKTKTEEWNIASLRRHCINPQDVDFSKVFAFCEDFLHEYYDSHLDYEIKAESLLNLLIALFDIRLDCSSETCSHEILSYLDPLPVKGIENYLSFLEKKGIPYFCLSNTIYPKEDTQSLLIKILPSASFELVEVSCDYAVKKPNPLFFKAGVKKAGLDISKCVYIGDKLYQDAYGSYRAGFLYSVYLDWKNKKEKHMAFLKSLSLDTDFPYILTKDYESLYKEEDK